MKRQNLRRNRGITVGMAWKRPDVVLLDPTWHLYDVRLEFEDDLDGALDRCEELGLEVLESAGGDVADHCETCMCETVTEVVVRSVGRTAMEAREQIVEVFDAQPTGGGLTRADFLYGDRDDGRLIAHA